MPLAKRCKLKNLSKNTAKSIVLKVQKSDAPKNKSQLASRRGQRCPSLNFLLEPEPSFFGFVFLGEPEPELFWFSFFRGSQSQSFFSFLFFGELEPELAKLDRPGSS